MEISQLFLMIGAAAAAVVCLGALGVGLFVGVLAWRRRSTGGDVSPETARQNLDRLLAGRDLQALQFEQTEWVRGSFDHKAIGSLEIWSSQVGLNNASGQPALLATAVLKNYKPFKGWLVSRFDQRELEIVLQPTPEYLFYLDGRLIGYMPFPGLLNGQVDYICDAERAPVLWHDRPLFHVIGARVAQWQIPPSPLKYKVYAEATQQTPVAEVSRACGRESFTPLPLDSTYIHFLQPLPLERKTLILGFLLIDLLFNA